jgi:hypothetical protein
MVVRLRCKTGIPELWDDPRALETDVMHKVKVVLACQRCCAG